MLGVGSSSNHLDTPRLFLVPSTASDEVPTPESAKGVAAPPTPTGKPRTAPQIPRLAPWTNRIVARARRCPDAREPQTLPAASASSSLTSDRTRRSLLARRTWGHQTLDASRRHQLVARRS